MADLRLQVPREPIRRDYQDRLFALQKLGKNKFSGPLYQIRLVGDADEELPFDKIRVLPHNMIIHPITELPVALGFVFHPENEPVRVRVPVEYINEEKCHGLREGGWLNTVQRTIEVGVAPFVKPPLRVCIDLAGMGLRDRKRVGDLTFEGKGNGCRTVASDDDIVTVISKV